MVPLRGMSFWHAISSLFVQSVLFSPGTHLHQSPNENPISDKAPREYRLNCRFFMFNEPRPADEPDPG